jgi:hypothetical protein
MRWLIVEYGERESRISRDIIFLEDNTRPWWQREHKLPDAATRMVVMVSDAMVSEAEAVAAAVLEAVAVNDGLIVGKESQVHCCISLATPSRAIRFKAIVCDRAP